MKYLRYMAFGLVVALVVAFSTSAAAEETAPPIRLQAGTFAPQAGETLDLPDTLTVTNYGQARQGGYLIQFSGPVQASWKAEVEATGAQIIEYIPDFAFRVRMNPAQAERVSALENVAWVGFFQPGYKLGPNVDLADGPALLRITALPGAQYGAVRSAIAQSGAEVLSNDDGIFLVAAYNEAQLVEIANVSDVAWVDQYLIPEKHNEYGAGQIVGAATANANGYDGSSQTVAVADTGLNDGTTSGTHAGLTGRVSNIFNWPGTPDSCFATIIDDGAQDVDSGHGTHVTLSVAGAGDANGVGRGAAPGATVIFQAVENYVQMGGICRLYYADGYYLTGLPADLNDAFQEAYDAGARIHANSWGSPQAGAYTDTSAQTDTFTWNNKDMTITFSAGNSGEDANSDGVVDNDSIGAPASAKNVITVGASENERPDNFPCDTGLSYTNCAAQGGVNDIFTWSVFGFNAAPLTDDPSAGNSQQMAAFSSRGPTDDGRIKPDVVAPGSWILSGYSDLYQQGYDGVTNPQTGQYQYDGYGFPYSSEYKYLSGTSMSNPIVAGAATVVRDYYNKAEGIDASSALVKATLINSAVDMLDENNDGADDNDFPIPNVHEGWGLIQLDAATDGSHQYVEGAGLNTGGSASYQYGINSGTFKVTLVWADYPSSTSASKNLVNDLDLKVTAPDGTVYYGNNFSGGWSTTGSADRTNNVENVYIQNATAGTWTVEVVGYNVAFGPQPYALVADGSFGSVDTAPTTSILNPADGSTVVGTTTVQIDATDAEDAAGTLNVEWNIDGGAWQAATYNSGTGTYEASWDSTTVADGVHTINARTTDSGANTSTASNAFTVDNINEAPIASFTSSCTDLACTFDGSGSSDPDGSISSYAWDFGDGSTGSGAAPSHTYAAAGTYTVTLTVTDNDGATDSTSQSVTVTEPVPNSPPTASFTSSCTDLACTFDGSGSSDSDGSIASYAWDFGDGSTGSGAAPSHTYAAAGTYTVTLTVTDDDGATDSTSQSVTVTEPVVSTMHVGDLDGFSTNLGRGQFEATVTILVVDNAGNPVSGVTVSGSWSTGGSATCTTDANGLCSVTSGAVRNREGGTTFTVTNLTGSLTYDSSANTDPDGDSDGTSIFVAK